jgi:hypothetical protein
MSEGRFDRSLADLMAGVAVVFLILAVIFIVEATRQRENAERLRQAAELEKKQLEQKVGGQKDEVARSLTLLHDQLAQLDAQFDGGFITLSDIADGGLNSLEIEFENFNFDSGRCATPVGQMDRLRQGSRPLVGRICAAVASIADAGAKPTIILEGHTDNVAFNQQSGECGVLQPSPGMAFDNNVRASAARAQSVFFTIRQALGDAGLELNCLDQNFVVAGRGQASPKQRQDPHDPSNRRLVIRVRGDLSL